MCPKKAPSKSWVAINARERARIPECLEWMPKREPDIIVNNHIWVFNMARE
jgi:hypothetical protein